MHGWGKCLKNNDTWVEYKNYMYRCNDSFHDLREPYSLNSLHKLLPRLEAFQKKKKCSTYCHDTDLRVLFSLHFRRFWDHKTETRTVHNFSPVRTGQYIVTDTHTHQTVRHIMPSQKNFHSPSHQNSKTAAVQKIFTFRLAGTRNQLQTALTWDI